MTERVGKRGIKPTREQAREPCPLAPTASIYRREGELLTTSQTKRENKCILEISRGKQEPGEPPVPMDAPPGLSPGEGWAAAGQREARGAE